jgi:hypothetical protein
VSLILDALNRSRREEDAVPGLATRHYAESPPGQGGWRRMLPWAGLCVALGVIAWLLLRDLPGDQPGTPHESVAPAAPRERPASQQPAPAPAPVAATPVAAGARSAEPAGQAATRRPPSTDAGAVAPRPSSPAPRAAAPPSAPDPEVAALYRQSQAEPVPAVAATAPEPEATGATQAVAPKAAAAREEPIDIARLVEQAESELKNRDLAEHTAPFLVELSQHTKDQIPTIYYQRHEYAGDPSRSTVVLNGKQLRVGGTAAPGVKVEEILPDSVVLSHDGREFRLRALNSWINL